MDLNERSNDQPLIDVTHLSVSVLAEDNVVIEDGSESKPEVMVMVMCCLIVVTFCMYIRHNSDTHLLLLHFNGWIECRIH